MDEVSRTHDLKLLIRVAQILFVNGETTEGTRRAVGRLAERLGIHALFTARWGDLSVRPDECTFGAQTAADPAGVDIGRVNATHVIVDDVCRHTVVSSRALDALNAIGEMPPVNLVRLALMAAVGAAALSIIFRAKDLLTVCLVASSAGLGACLRRVVSHFSSSPFLQPFVASLLAGVMVSAASAIGLPVSLHLLAACPCMVLVPGPHFLNGMIDLARGRIALGFARVLFASLIVLAISTGLIVGLSIDAPRFSSPSSGVAVSLAYDVGAAGLAVAAYGAFFNMPWKMLPLPVCIGMMAHALRWALLDAGASAQLGALVACALVGSCTAVLSRRLRLPFGACAFAAVVSLIPGIFMFQTVSDALAIVQNRSDLSAVVIETAGDIVTASMILVAMATGLIVPKMLYDMCVER